jgi:hypothetical protein
VAAASAALVTTLMFRLTIYRFADTDYRDGILLAIGRCSFFLGGTIGGISTFFAGLHYKYTLALGVGTLIVVSLLLACTSATPIELILLSFTAILPVAIGCVCGRSIGQLTDRRAG